MQNFLRIQNYTDLQGSATCARYMATQSTIVHGCVCTSPTGHCNQINQSREYQMNNVVARRMNDQNYCYSLHQKSKKPFNQDVFKKWAFFSFLVWIANRNHFSSETCEGHYCFISMTSSELAVENTTLANSNDQSFVGVARPRYEILAGCVKVDDDHVTNQPLFFLIFNLIIESECWMHYGVCPQFKWADQSTLYLW